MVPRQQLLSHGAEAVATVHWPVAARQERHLRVNATLGAHRRMHFSRAAAVPAAASLLATASTPAGRASAGLIGEPLGCEELLFTYREDEG